MLIIFTNDQNLKKIVTYCRKLYYIWQLLTINIPQNKMPLNTIDNYLEKTMF